ncbi:hypothetical protein GQ55_1G357300 [Panicum hallii var. hallii]|uniref:Uncharacterized protein n=1 Tax=Panicum hallii var. hallii TaxID=1504633 RepID=A0A2T7FB24_9POAL|nr:hypothetical protein GQ55_1G357300 [Panicum hallii var. hallii]
MEMPLERSQGGPISDWRPTNLTMTRCCCLHAPYDCPCLTWDCKVEVAAVPPCQV